MASGQPQTDKNDLRAQDALSTLVRLLAVQAAREAVASHSEPARTDEDPENEQEQDHR
jgi:hypothetical protein